MDLSFEVELPDLSQCELAANDVLKLEFQTAATVATQMVRQAMAYTPYDTKATMHPDIVRSSSGSVMINYNARNPQGDYYADYVNRGIGHGAPVVHYSHQPGPHFIEKMTATSNVQSILNDYTQDLGSMLAGSVFSSQMRFGLKNARGGVSYRYYRPKVIKAREWEKYTSSKN